MTSEGMTGVLESPSVRRRSNQSGFESPEVEESGLSSYRMSSTRKKSVVKPMMNLIKETEEREEQ